MCGKEVPLTAETAPSFSIPASRPSLRGQQTKRGCSEAFHRLAGEVQLAVMPDLAPLSAAQVPGRGTVTPPEAQ